MSSRHAKVQRWRKWLVMFAYSSGPLIFIFDRVVRDDSRILVFQTWAIGYVVTIFGQLISGWALLTNAGRQLHSRVTGRGMYMGTALHLTVPLSNFVTYGIFWSITLTIKMLFGYWGLASPMAAPVTALWELKFDGTAGKLDWSSMSGDVALGTFLYRIMLITMRLSTPTAVFFFDTGIFYTVRSRIRRNTRAHLAALAPTSKVVEPQQLLNGALSCPHCGR